MKKNEFIVIPWAKFVFVFLSAQNGCSKIERKSGVHWVQ